MIKTWGRFLLGAMSKNEQIQFFDSQMYLVIIDRMFIYHSVDHDLRVEIILRKERTAENEGIDFEIEDIGNSGIEG